MRWIVSNCGHVVLLAMPLFLHILTLRCTSTTTSKDENTFNVVTFVSMTIGGRPIANSEVVASYVAMVIAMKHFNERNSSVLNVMSELGGCKARLKLIGGGLYDDQVLSSAAMSHLISTVAQIVGITAGALHIPMISYLAGSEQLSNKQIYPTTFRITPSDLQPIEDLIQLLVVFGYRTIGFLYSTTSSISTYNSLLQDACARRNIRVHSVSVIAGQTRGPTLDASILQGLKVLTEQKLHIILRSLVTVDDEVAFAKAALTLNWTAGNFHISRFQASFQDIFRTAPTEDWIYLRRFYDGTFVLRQTYNTNTSAYKSFVDAWPTQNASYINEHFATKIAGNGQSLVFPQNYFSQPISGLLLFGVSYDSMIALGLAACGSSDDLVSNLRFVDFTGISGNIRFNDKLNRDAKYDGVYSFLENYISIPNTDIGISSQVPAYVVTGDWSIDRFLIRFSDGTNRPPLDTDRPPISISRVTTAARIWGGVETVLTVLPGTAGLIKLTFDPDINKRIGLPRLIHIRVISLGSILLGASIATLLIESNAACMLFYWCFLNGFCLIVSGITAEAMRTWILERRRQKSARRPTSTLPANGDSTSRFVVQTLGRPTSQRFAINKSSLSHDINNSRLSSLTMAQDRGLSTTHAYDGPTLQQSFDATNPQCGPKQDSLHSCEQIDDVSGVWQPTGLMFMQVLGVVVLCLVMQVLAPVNFTFLVSERDADGYPISTYATCASAPEQRDLFLAIIITLTSLIGIYTIGALVIAIIVRNYQQFVFGMNKVILAGFGEFQVFFTGLPIAVVAAQSALGYFLVLSSIAFFSSIIVSVMLILPITFTKLYSKMKIGWTQEERSAWNQREKATHSRRRLESVTTIGHVLPTATSGGGTQNQLLVSTNEAVAQTNVENFASPGNLALGSRQHTVLSLPAGDESRTIDDGDTGESELDTAAIGRVSFDRQGQDDSSRLHAGRIDANYFDRLDRPRKLPGFFEFQERQIDAEHEANRSITEDKLSRTIGIV